LLLSLFTSKKKWESKEIHIDSTLAFSLLNSLY
jgi:hypothetical protein